MRLYEIGTEMQALYNLIEMDAGEVTEEHEELISQVNEIIEKKTDSIGEVFHKLNDEIELADKHIKRLQEYKKARKNNVERLKTLIGDYLNQVGEKKIQGQLFEATKRKPTPRAEIEDENKIPRELTQIKVEVKKGEVLKKLKAGEDIPGAKLVEGKEAILIKNKSLK